MDNYLDTDFRFESKIIEFVNKCSEEIEKDFENLKIVEEYNQLKVLNAFKKQKLIILESKLKSVSKYFSNL